MPNETTQPVASRVTSDRQKSRIPAASHRVPVASDSISTGIAASEGHAVPVVIVVSPLNQPPAARAPSSVSVATPETRSHPNTPVMSAVASRMTKRPGRMRIRPAVRTTISEGSPRSRSKGLVPPPVADRPFRDLDNVVMTPHVGGGLGEPGIETHRATALVEILRRLRG